MQWERVEVSRGRVSAPAFLHAILITGAVLGLYYYWFAVADRYAVFLYDHLGATPFDAITTSRYIMTGAVAGGYVLVGYCLIAHLRGLWATWRGDVYVPPPWWQVWMISAPPLGAGIFYITTTQNSPTLPPEVAMLCVVAAWAALALALPPARWAVRRPRDLVLLAGDGLGLLPSLLLLRALELPFRDVLGPGVAMAVALGSIVGGGVWMLGMAALRTAIRARHPGAGRVFLAGLSIAYLGLPLVHHLLFTPAEYRYITDAANFYPQRSVLRLVALASATLLALISQAGHVATPRAAAPIGGDEPPVIPASAGTDTVSRARRRPVAGATGPPVKAAMTRRKHAGRQPSIAPSPPSASVDHAAQPRSFEKRPATPRSPQSRPSGTVAIADEEVPPDEPETMPLDRGRPASAGADDRAPRPPATDSMATFPLLPAPGRSPDRPALPPVAEPEGLLGLRAHSNGKMPKVGQKVSTAVSDTADGEPVDDRPLRIGATPLRRWTVARRPVAPRLFRQRHARAVNRVHGWHSRLRRAAPGRTRGMRDRRLHRRWR